MALFRRRRQQSGSPRRASSEDMAHLEQFVQTRPGVEAYLEPRTTVTETTLVLVAANGEWTRRRVPDSDAARDLGRRLAIPVYDANLVGYPKRMREWTAQRKAAGDTGVPRGGPDAG